MLLIRDEGLRDKGTWGRLDEGDESENGGRVIICCPECGVRFTIENAITAEGHVIKSVACPALGHGCSFHDSDVRLDEYDAT